MHGHLQAFYFGLTLKLAIFLPLIHSVSMCMNTYNSYSLAMEKVMSPFFLDLVLSVVITALKTIYYLYALRRSIVLTEPGLSDQCRTQQGS